MPLDPAVAASREPESVAEWEDLLYRLELMPRALRVELEAAGAGPDDRTLDVLNAMAEREAEAAVFLARACDAGEGEIPRGAGGTDEAPADRFERLRRRVFAVVQRRGIDVWSWTAPWGDVPDVTIYQLLMQLAVDDAAALARLRDFRKAAAPC